MNKEIEPVLSKIAQALNASHVLWGVGASLLLHQYGLVEDPTDIDILVSVDDISTVDKLLSSLGEKQPETPSDIYATDYFYEYIINGINVDVIAGLKIKQNKAVFEYTFDKESAPHTFFIGGVPVPFSTLEDWYILYRLMPGKESKSELIAGYFREHGVRYPVLMERMNEKLRLCSIGKY
ncbi:nucleotidyltransferase family protein [Viscerimonas tarda]